MAGASGRRRSSVYGQPQFGTVQSGSSSFSAEAPAEATVERATVLTVYGPRAIIVTTAGAGDPRRTRCDTRPCSAACERPRQHPAAAVPDQAERPRALVEAPGEGSLDLCPQPVRAPGVDGQGRPGRRVPDARQPGPQRLEVGVGPNRPGMTTTVRPSPRGTPRPKKTGSRCNAASSPIAWASRRRTVPWSLLMVRTPGPHLRGSQRRPMRTPRRASWHRTVVASTLTLVYAAVYMALTAGEVHVVGDGRDGRAGGPGRQRR